MAPSAEDIGKAVAARLPDAQAFLARLVEVPSLSGDEAEALAVAEDAFAQIAEVTRVPMSDALRKDPAYSDPIPGLRYDGRHNLRCAMPGAGAGGPLLFSTHIDTVPPSPGQSGPFTAAVRDGNLYGRGSCDAKGQVATIYLAMAALKELNAPLPAGLTAHIVVEEENGGNGTLSMVRHGEAAGACVLLEPTELRVLTSVRGAVWFRATVTGVSGHSGMAGHTRSALMAGVRIIEIWTDYHRRLLEASRNVPLFEKYPNPMPLTIGELHAGNWPASAPGEARLTGVLGFLPNKSATEVMAEMREAIAREGGAELARACGIQFTYRHDASVLDPAHPLSRAMCAALEAQGHMPLIDAMTASCDAWFYNNLARIPTLVFGGGSLSVAHSKDEHMPLNGLASAAEALVHLASHWRGESG